MARPYKQSEKKYWKIIEEHSRLEQGEGGLGSKMLTSLYGLFSKCDKICVYL